MSDGAARRLRIGVSACIFHADPARPVFNGKALYYLERSMAEWVASQGALAYLIPPPLPGTSADLAADLDALVVAGGVDVCPRSYGEEPERPEWSGDAVRDAYEIGLIHAMIAQKKPVLGVCRGHQVLNVALGGSLYQDIVTHVPRARTHRDAGLYDANAHEIELTAGQWLASLYPERSRWTINTVHHQAVKRLGEKVRAIAHCVDDGVVEAITVDIDSYARGVQWHPEFMFAQRTTNGPAGDFVLDNTRILTDLMSAARTRRDG